MSYELPPKLAEMKLQVSRSHNNRLLLWMVSLAIYVFIIVKFPLLPIPVIGLGGLIEIVGLIYVMWRNKKQCVQLGFICPFCGGTLYENSRYSNRLWRDGECPRCGEFILDKFQ
jgi:hypothetical protein